MNRKRLLLTATAILSIMALPIGWYLISPLFITRAVNEDFPVAQAALLPTQTADTMPEKTANTLVSQPDHAMLEKTAAAMASHSADKTMMHSPEATAAPTKGLQPKANRVTASATAAPTEPKLLLSGEFHAVEHHGTGMAAIYQLPDGKRVLRLENLDVLNGPDLYVWLAGAADANDNQTILDGGYFEVAPLKGNTGNQNYELPADLDLSKYHSVTIWCRQFSVNFATASLQ